jgi:hypothetical protein
MQRTQTLRLGWHYAASAALAAMTTPGALATRYVLVDLGTGSAIYSDGRAIDDAGWCVGFSGGAQSADRAFRTDGIRPLNPQTDDLGTLGGTYAQAYGVNGLGQAVGLAGTIR